jgi:hypothetical protein
VIVRERERTSDNGWGLARVIDYIQHYLIHLIPNVWTRLISVVMCVLTFYIHKGTMSSIIPIAMVAGVWYHLAQQGITTTTIW